MRAYIIGVWVEMKAAGFTAAEIKETLEADEEITQKELLEVIAEIEEAAE